VKASAYLDYVEVADLGAAVQLGTGKYQLPLRQGDTDKETPMTKEVDASQVVSTINRFMKLGR